MGKPVDLGVAHHSRHAFDAVGCAEHIVDAFSFAFSVFSFFEFEQFRIQQLEVIAGFG